MASRVLAGVCLQLSPVTSRAGWGGTLGDNGTSFSVGNWLFTCWRGLGGKRVCPVGDVRVWLEREGSGEGGVGAGVGGPASPGHPGQGAGLPLRWVSGDLLKRQGRVVTGEMVSSSSWNKQENELRWKWLQLFSTFEGHAFLLGLGGRCSAVSSPRKFRESCGWFVLVSSLCPQCADSSLSAVLQ